MNPGFTVLTSLSFPELNKNDELWIQWIFNTNCMLNFQSKAFYCKMIALNWKINWKFVFERTIRLSLSFRKLIITKLQNWYFIKYPEGTWKNLERGPKANTQNLSHLSAQISQLSQTFYLQKPCQRCRR